MGCASALIAAKVGQVACLAQCLPTAREHLRRIHPDASEEDILGASPLDGAIRELQALRDECGMEVNMEGEIATGAEPRLDLKRPFIPMRGLTGMLTRRIYELDRARIFGNPARANNNSRSESAKTKAKRTVSRIQSCEGGAGLWVEHGLKKATSD